MNGYCYWTPEYRRELLAEWWQTKVALRLCKGLYGACALLRARQRSIEQVFKKEVVR